MGKQVAIIAGGGMQPSRWTLVAVVLVVVAGTTAGTDLDNGGGGVRELGSHEVAGVAHEDGGSDENQLLGENSEARAQAIQAQSDEVEQLEGGAVASVAAAKIGKGKGKKKTSKKKPKKKAKKKKKPKKKAKKKKPRKRGKKKASSKKRVSVKGGCPALCGIGALSAYGLEQCKKSKVKKECNSECTKDCKGPPTPGGKVPQKPARTVKRKRKKPKKAKGSKKGKKGKKGKGKGKKGGKKKAKKKLKKAVKGKMTKKKVATIKKSLKKKFAKKKKKKRL